MAHPAENIPPLLEAPRRKYSEAALILPAIAAAILVARFSEGFDITALHCRFKALTGLPCAFCGGTRSLRALTHLDFSGAFFWNPLVFIGTFAIAIASILRLVLPRPATDRWLNAIQERPWAKIAIFVVLLNWIYLILFLPR